MNTHAHLRAGLPPLPPDMRTLPVDTKTGFPVPVFVAWISGAPDFRMSDIHKLTACTVERRCMICGNSLRGENVFAFPAINALNRGNDEPPMHWACAEWSAQVCPWMMKPCRPRNEVEKPPTMTNQVVVEASGFTYQNKPPKVWVLYDAEDFKVETLSNGYLVFRLGEAREIRWYSEGRRAGKGLVEEAISDAFEMQSAAFEAEPNPVKRALLKADMMESAADLGRWVPSENDHAE